MSDSMWNFIRDSILWATLGGVLGGLTAWVVN